jgi:tetratricopeptide (TPR) repeat protein
MPGSMTLRLLKVFAVVCLLIFSCALPIHAPSAFAEAGDEKELFFVAQSAFDDGFYDVAIRYIDEFLQKFPQSEKRLQAQLLSGQCYFFKNQYLKAFNIFQELLAHPEFKDATLFWLGETYLKGSDYVQAEKNYRQVIDLYPTSVYVPQAYYSLGWTLFDQKKFKEAQDTFKLMVEKFPGHQLTEDAILKIAECEYNLGSFATAAELFKDYLTKYPQSLKAVQVNFNIAESYYYLEKYSEANAYYKKVEESGPDPSLVVAARISQGWGNLKLKNYDESINAFNQAEALATLKGVLSDEIYLGKASFFSETGDNEHALESYSKLIELFPKSDRLLEAHLGKANIYYATQQYPKAIEEYKIVIDANDQNPDHQDTVEKANFGLAWTYLKMGQVDQSIASFQTILDKTKSAAVKVSALTQIGDAYQDLEKPEKAIELYDKILKDYPESVYSDYVQYREGIAFLKCGRIESATLGFQSLRQNFPKSKYLNDVDYYLGVAYFKKNDWATAVKSIETFLNNSHHPEEFVPEANYVLALSYLNLGNADEALKLFQKISKLYSGDQAVARNAEIGIAKALHQQGQDKEAVKKFKLIIYKYPNTDAELESLLWLGQYFYKTGEYASSADYYEQIIGRFPGTERINQIRYELGQVYEMQGVYDKALNQYKLINSSDHETFARAGLAIAAIFSKELDPQKAAETYQDIIAKSPDFRRDAYMKLAQVYQKNNNYAKEIETYEKTLASEKGLSNVTDVELQFAIGDTYELMGNFDKANEAYLKIPYLYKDEIAWVIKAYLRVARIYENSQNWENARTTYAKILAFNTEEAKYAQERIDWIDHLPSRKR